LKQGTRNFSVFYMTLISKLGLCEWNIPSTDISERFKWSAQAGLQGLEIDLESCSDDSSSNPEKIERVRELSESWNLEIPTLGINACCKYGMGNPNHQPLIETALAAGVETALALGIPKLQVPSFSASWIESEDDLTRTIGHFRFACRLAEGTDLIIGTENALTAQQQLQMLDQVESAHFKIYFDTRNAFSMQGYDSAEILKQLLPHLCEVHIKDGIDEGPSCALGAGNSGLFNCLELLKKNAYDGWLLLENNYQTIEQCQTDINTARSYFE
jgi:sugar phosphate isomerase/epimerase